MAKKTPVLSKKDTRFIKAIGSKSLLKIRLPHYITPQLLILCSTVVFTILLFPFKETVHSLDLPKLGEAAKETIIAPFTFDIVRSRDELERERKKAADQVLLIIDYDSGVLGKVKSHFTDLKKSLNLLQDTLNFDSTRIYRRTLSKIFSEKTIDILSTRPYLVDDALYLAEEMLDKGISFTLLVPSIEKLSELRSRFNTSFNQHIFYDKQFVTIRHDTLESTISSADITVKEIALENAMKDLRRDRKLDDETLNTLYELLFVFINPNIRVNNALTLQRKEKAAQDILEISGKVIKDTEIARKHQEVSAEIIQKISSLRRALEKMGDRHEKRKAATANAGRVILALIPLLFLAFYLKIFKYKIVESPKHLSALALLLTLQVMIIRVSMFIVARLFIGTAEVSSYLVPEYLVPVSAVSLLTAILFGYEISFVLTLYSAIYFGILTGFSYQIFLYTLLGGIISGFFGRNMRYRLHFFKTIIPVTVIYMVVVTLWHLIGYKISVLYFFQNYGLACISVIVSTFLAMMFTPVFERLFDITTDMTLVELSDMNHPLLKRLSIEAAGTYNHSVLVGNLAESAAQKIGANPLLARVASYYHDIGKIEKSDYFVENCLTVDKSRHNKLTPSMSALIICAHVKDGVELAKASRVPKVIQDIIMQHHGTSTVSYFYEKALELDPHKQVQEKDFSYPGPLPQTREAAIIMLADSVEAAARSLGTSSPKLLRELVKKIIRDKFLSSQLDQSDLTLRDLDEIVEGFMPVLQGIFHSRIEYPTRDKEIR